MALGQVVDGPAEGGMAPEEVDVPARQVQNVGGHAGEDVEVGDQLAQTLLVKEYVHFRYCFTMASSSAQRDSMSATSLNWVRQRSRFWASRLMWK